MHISDRHMLSQTRITQDITNLQLCTRVCLACMGVSNVIQLIYFIPTQLNNTQANIHIIQFYHYIITLRICFVSTIVCESDWHMV